jgi:integrase
MLAALRGTLKEAWRLNLMTTEEYHRAADIADLPHQSLPRGRALTHGEITSLIETCYHDAAYYDLKSAQRATDHRDAAIIALLYAIGLRRQEVVALDLADYTAETGAIRIRSGKGRKARTSYLASGAVAALNDWLSIRGTEPGPLFCSLRRGDTVAPAAKLTHKRLSDQAILYILDQH